MFRIWKRVFDGLNRMFRIWKRVFDGMNGIILSIVSDLNALMAIIRQGLAKREKKPGSPLAARWSRFRFGGG